MAKRMRGDVELDPELEEDLDELIEEDDLLDEDEKDEEESEEEVDDDDDDDDDDFDDDDDDIEDVDDDEEEGAGEYLFEEEAGYAESFDWSTLPEADRLRHEEYLNADPEKLRGLNTKRLTLFDRWAAAQAFARQGMREEFQEACRSIIKSRKKAPELLYEDIFLELISDLADCGAFDEAFAHLERFLKTFPEESDVYQRVRGLLLIESGEIHAGKALLDELMAQAADHGELHLEIGDDLLAMGHPELALRILERGKDFARRSRDTELMTALDETRRLARDQIEEDL